MRKPEQKLWDHVSRVMAGRWKADRIENSVGQAVPDVFYHLQGTDGKYIPNLEVGWIELKMATVPKIIDAEKTIIRIPTFTEKQREWICSRGVIMPVWVLVQIGKFHMIFNSDMAMSLGNMTLNKMAKRSSFCWFGPIAGEELSRVLAGTMPRHPINLLDARHPWIE